MGQFKKKVKNKYPKDYKELKKFRIEDWNIINQKNYFTNFIKKSKNGFKKSTGID